MDISKTAHTPPPSTVSPPPPPPVPLFVPVPLPVPFPTPLLPVLLPPVELSGDRAPRTTQSIAVVAKPPAWETRRGTKRTTVSAAAYPMKTALRGQSCRPNKAVEKEADGGAEKGEEKGEEKQEEEEEKEEEEEEEEEGEESPRRVTCPEKNPRSLPPNDALNRNHGTAAAASNTP